MSALPLLPDAPLRPNVVMSILLIQSVTWLLNGLSGSLFLLCLLIFLETLAFLLPGRRRRTPLPQNPAHQAAIVIPAHNEATGLAATLAPLVELPYPIILVADNCTDQTAAIGRQFGVVVLERQHESDRGKGFAMDFGLNYLRPDPPDVVLFLDADCLITAPQVQRLVDYAGRRQRPVQALYLMQLPPAPTTKHRVSAFAFRFKNHVRMQGLSRLRGPIVLSGSGMAFPWHCLADVNLASASIVEDMKLGIDLAIAGNPALFCADTIVTSALPQQSTVANRQRTRWEHGHLQSIGLYAPKLLRASWEQRRFDLLLLAWDLCIPPLSLMALVWLVSFGLMAAAAQLGFGQFAFKLVLAAGVMLTGAILLAWQRVGRSDLPLADLLRVPFYVFGKVPLYLRFITARQQAWERTDRDGPGVESTLLSSKN
jgi:cellulose synthase/poly-beta-1,6-N-acetylglucosamine synthase-like glycosyltransferase